MKVFASFREESVIFSVKKLLKVHVCMVFIHFVSFACSFYTFCQFYLSFLQVLLVLLFSFAHFVSFVVRFYKFCEFCLPLCVAQMVQTPHICGAGVIFYYKRHIYVAPHHMCVDRRHIYMMQERHFSTCATYMWRRTSIF